MRASRTAIARSAMMTRSRRLGSLATSRVAFGDDALFDKAGVYSVRGSVAFAERLLALSFTLSQTRWSPFRARQRRRPTDRDESSFTPHQPFVQMARCWSYDRARLRWSDRRSDIATSVSVGFTQPAVGYTAAPAT